MTVITTIMFVNDFFIHNLDGDVSFANNHGCMMRFRGPMRPRRVHAILNNTFIGTSNAGTAADTVTVNASNGAVHMSAGCVVRDGDPAISSRTRAVLCGTLGGTGLMSRGDIRTFGGPSIHRNNSVVDDAGMNPSMTGSVAVNTVCDILFTLVTVFLCVLVHFHGITFSMNSAITLTFSTLAIVNFCSLL